MRFYKIPEDAFNGLQVEAGMLLTKFDPANPAEPADEDILCATTGGINVVCQPEFSDYGEDVDNVPNNMMEFKRLVGWTCSMSFTSLGTNSRLIKWALGAADIDTENADHIVPRMNVKLTDYGDIWWVGERADEGLVAIRLMNALSTSGFSLQTSKGGKGNISCEITGHVSIQNQELVPMEFYSSAPEDAGFTVKFNSDGGTDVASQTVKSGETATRPADPTKTNNTFNGWYSDEQLTNLYDFSAQVTANITLYAKWTVTAYAVTQNLTGVTSSFTDNSVAAGGSFTATLTADNTVETVSVTMGGQDVTSTVYDDSTDTVTISEVTGDIVITATGN